MKSHRSALNLSLGWLALISMSGSVVRGSDCTAEQNAIADARKAIAADQQQLRVVGQNITAQDLDDWTKMVEQGRQQAILAAALSLLTGLLSSAEAALQTKNIAGYTLKNGLGSIGTGQANALVTRLRAQGPIQELLVPAIRTLSTFKDKTATLEYLEMLSKAGSALKSLAELGASSKAPEDGEGPKTTEQAEALFALAAAISGKADLAVSLASALFDRGRDEFYIYMLAKSINNAASANEARLSAIKSLSLKLQKDVQLLQNAKARLDACERPTGAVSSNWQADLQKQRLDAISANNIALYNNLLQRSLAIFEQHSVQPCQSAFFPSGCSSAQKYDPSLKKSVPVISSCAPPAAKDAIEAVHIEASSTHDGCYGRDSDGNLFFTSHTAPNVYKPLVSGGNPAAGSLKQPPTAQVSSSPTATTPASGATGAAGAKSAPASPQNSTNGSANPSTSGSVAPTKASTLSATLPNPSPAAPSIPARGASASPALRPGVSVTWHGANAVGIDLVDSTQKLRIGYFACGGGQTCNQSQAPGSYYLKMSPPGFEQLIPVNIPSGGAAVIEPNVGTIAFKWVGANAVGIDIVDATKKLRLGYFACGNGQTCKQDVAVGSYFLKLGTPGFEQLIPITVIGSALSEVKPSAGVVAFHWSGTAAVGLDIIDSTQKYRLGYFACGNGQTCKQDLAAGNYFIRPDAQGMNTLIPVSITEGQTTQVSR